VAWPSAIRYPLSAIRYPLSAIRYPLVCYDVILHMTHRQLTILPESDEEKSSKSLLHKSILRKRAYLKTLVIRSETLKVKLDLVKQEYMVKIGSLVLKDSHLDLEIIHLRNLLSLIEEGLTYEEAVKQLEMTFYADQLRIEQEQEKMRYEERIFQKRFEERSEELIADTKKLWKKLIASFHPDLAQQADEKKRRTEIMKQINSAYAEGDYSALVKIEHEFTVGQHSDLLTLEDVLIQLENEILHQEQVFKELQDSEWYRWELKLSRTKKPLEDIFAGVERTFLSDIMAKIEMIKNLKEQLIK